MSVKIRLTRVGKRNQPSYRVIAIDESKKQNGRYLEELGFYNPMVKPPEFKIKKDRYNYWVSVGGRPTEVVKRLVK